MATRGGVFGEAGAEAAVVGFNLQDACGFHVAGKIVFQAAFFGAAGFEFGLHGFDVLFEQVALGGKVEAVGGDALGFGFKLADNGFDGVLPFGFVVEVGIQRADDVGGAFVEFDVHTVLHGKPRLAGGFGVSGSYPHIVFSKNSFKSWVDIS